MCKAQAGNDTLTQAMISLGNVRLVIAGLDSCPTWIWAPFMNVRERVCGNGDYCNKT